MKRWLYGKLVLESLAAVLLVGGCSALAAASVDLTVVEQQGIARRGEHKTHEILLYFHAGPASADGNKAIACGFSDPLRLEPSPKWEIQAPAHTALARTAFSRQRLPP